MLEQFSHAYLRKRPLQAALRASERSPATESQPSALTLFAAKAQQAHVAVQQPTARTNGKHDHLDVVRSVPFVRSLEAEVDRLSRHVASYIEGLWLRLIDVVHQLQQSTAATPQSCGAEIHAARKACLEDLRGLCDSLGADLVAIHTFVAHNAYAAACLALQHDLGDEALPADSFPPDSWESPQPHAQLRIYAVCMHRCMLPGGPHGNLGALLVGLSDAYTWLRGLLAEQQLAGGTWVAPARFQRDTTKFWMRPQDAMRFKAEMIRHVPVLIYGHGPFLSGDIRQSPEDMVASLQRPHVGALTDWTAISSVYFDDSDFQTYTLRMKREDGASVVRVRWYGQRSMSGSQELFLERKVHREPWTGERSFKHNSINLSQTVNLLSS
ncbi:hypothetical protein WJX73_000794 [Symbiochloris irregularis]|uniref:VTC domain-containing protein n=1 Tax=Symbiochloris irregularis TaxID=706552 RepID=A0AAW1PE49_9CHLO